MSMIQDNEFPKPYEKCYLEVEDGHKLYIEQIGNPNGIPFVFLHGGPGSGCQNNHRALFNYKENRRVESVHQGWIDYDGKAKRRC